MALVIPRVSHPAERTLASRLLPVASALLAVLLAACPRPDPNNGAVLTLSPAGAPAGTTLSISIRGGEGTSFGAGTRVFFDGAPVPGSSTDINPTERRILITVTIDEDHPPGAVAVEVDEDEDDSLPPLSASFNVLDPGLLASITIDPPFGVAGETLPLAITGANTNFDLGPVSLEFFADGSPLTGVVDATDVVVISATELVLAATIAEKQPTGIVTLVVQTDLGGGEAEIAAGAFGIFNEADSGTISVSPVMVPRGARDFPISIAAEGNLFFDAMTRVELGAPGLSVRSTSLDTLQRLTARVDVGPLAPLGETLLVEVTGPSKAVTIITVVDRLPLPVVDLVGSPARPGGVATFDLDLQGVTLGATSDVELVAGGGLVSAVLTAGAPPSVTVELSRGFSGAWAPFFVVIDTTAPDPERVPAAVPIALPGPPEIAEVSPSGVAVGTSGAALTVTGVGTNFSAGLTYADVIAPAPTVCGDGLCDLGEGACAGDCPAGAPVSVTGLVITAPDTAILTVDVDPFAPVTPAFLRLTTGSEVAEGLVLIGASGGPRAATVPAVVGAGRTVVVDLVTDQLDLTTATVDSFAPADLSVEAVEVLSRSRARLTLTASATAVPGPVTLDVDDGSAVTLMDVEVEAGTPHLVGTVTAFQGDVLEQIDLFGRFTSFSAAGTPSVASAGLIPTDLWLEETLVGDAEIAAALVTVGMFAATGSRPVWVRTDTELVAIDLMVVEVPKNPLVLPAPGGVVTVVGTIQPTAGTPAVVYEMVGSAGDLVTFTANPTAGGLNPTLRLFDRDGVTVLAHNDDADVFSVAAEVTYALPADGLYYVRLGAETDAGGNYSLRARVLDAPVSEAEPNDDPIFANAPGADPLASPIVLRGNIESADDVDLFRIDLSNLHPLPVLVVEAAARALVDDLAAAPDLVVEVLDAFGDPLLDVMGPTSADDRSSGALFDPLLAFPVEMSGTYLVRVTSWGGTTGPYMLNLRGPLVINEVFYNPAGGSDPGTFVELAGYPGLALDDLGISVRSLLCTGAPCACNEDPAVGITPEDLAGVVFPPSGLLVVGDIPLADVELDCPTGTCPTDFSNDDATVVELMADPDGTGGTLLDRVRWAALPTTCPVSEGSPAPNPTDLDNTSIGRGLGFDGDDNGTDFVQQVRPSPGAANVTRF